VLLEHHDCAPLVECSGVEPFDEAAASGLRMEVAASFPVVSVPVLSKAAVPQFARASSTTVPVTKIPLHRHHCQLSKYVIFVASCVHAGACTE